MLATIWAVLGPALLLGLKEVIPQILPKIIGNLVDSIFNPPTPVESAKIKIDDALAEGDLSRLAEINSTVINTNELNEVNKDELRSMLDLVE